MLKREILVYLTYQENGHVMDRREPCILQERTALNLQTGDALSC